MASMSSIPFVLSFLVGNIGCETWNFTDFGYSVQFSLMDLLSCDSAVFCAVRCSSMYYVDMIAVQDNFCYCLNPRQEYLTSPVRQIHLSSVYSRTTESICISRGYSVLSELGICIKYFNTTECEWEDAKHICNQDGGYLINLNTNQKTTSVLDFMSVFADSYIHIGGYTDNPLTTEFRWTRGGVVNDRWALGEPTGGERCLALCTSWGAGYADIPCNWSKTFLCEILL